MTAPALPIFGAHERPAVDFHDLVDHLPDAVVCLDFDRVVRYANRAAAELFGHAGGALGGRRFGDVWSGVFEGDPDPVLRQAIESRSPGACVTRRTGSGDAYDVGVRPGASGLSVSFHAVPAAVPSPPDVRAGELAQGDFDQQAEQLRGTLRRRDDAVGLLDAWMAASPVAYAFLDADLRFVRLNRAQAELNGLPVEDHIGRGIEQVLPPRAAQTLAGTLRHVLQTRQPLVGMDYASVASNGPRHVMASFYPVLAADGSVLGVGMVTLDVTELKRTQQSLVASRRDLTLAVDAAGLGYAQLDLRTRRLTLSERCRQILNVGPDREFTYDDWTARVHADDGRRVTDGIDRAVRERTVYRDEYRLVRSDGSVQWVEVRAQAEYDAAGQAVRFGGFVGDVTERKVAEQMLRDSEVQLREARDAAEAASRAKDNFMAALSHELRTPLTPVVMTLAAMEMNPDLPSGAREDVRTIRRNIELETRLIDDLLDVTRVAHDKLRLQPRPTHVHELIAVVVAICMPDLRARRLTLVRDLRAGHDLVTADPSRFQQVLWNLLKNAVKFTPEGGTVTVRTFNDPGDGPGAPSAASVGAAGPAAGVRAPALVLEVVDTGLGMDAEAVRRIFNPFEQADASVTRHFGGLGLGLTISKAIVELHGGSIRAASPGRDRGSTFTVRIPTAVPSQRVLDHAPAAPANADSGRLRLLVVEDHPETLRVLRRLLEIRGHTVATADTVAGACALLRQQAFDLLLSDIGLPDASGLDLMRLARDRYALPGVAMSGFGMDGDLRKSAEAGFSAHLIKPIDPRALEAAMREAAGRRNAPVGSDR
jgi:PAS domain S-box-containing protein